MRKPLLLTSLLLTLFAPFVAWAIESADVLPDGVRSFSVKMGTLTGLNQFYTDTGQLKYISDMNAVNLDVATLNQIDDSTEDLVNILNQFGPDNLGNQLNLGQLKVETNPEVNYYTPILLYGVSSQWTIGVGIPIVKYSNDLSVRLKGSNLEKLSSQFTGASSELDAAINRLNVDLTRAFQDTLVKKGYERIENREDTFIGDVQLISAYQFANIIDYKNAAQVIVGLPTGPKPNPDDLTDIESFSHWTIKPALISEKRLNAQMKVMGSLSYQAVLPMDVEKRVPLNSADKLPSAQQKDTLHEDMGDTWSIGSAVKWEMTDSFNTGVGYSFEQKQKDWIAGSEKGDASLLVKNTDSQASLAKLELNYSTIKDFKNKKASVPATLSYEISQVVNNPIARNKNIENQTRHDLWLSIYF